MDTTKKTRKIRKTKKKIKLILSSVDRSKEDIISPIFKNKDDIEACKQEKKTQEELNKTRKIFREKKELCENELYKYIFTFFRENESLEGLIESLYNFYNHKKKQDNAFTLSFSDFIYMFPRDTTQKGFNFKRQHVFEQICRILLLLNYDRNYFGNNKIFYNSLEDFTKGYKKEQTKTDILSSKINDGSSAQSVDIFFKIPRKKVRKVVYKNACENDFSITDETKKKDLYILIQNKFYDKEYSSADKYDVTKIAHRAKELSSEQFDTSDYKIILMVNNKQLLDNKIKKNRNEDFGLVSEIFGLQELEQWFQNMLFDMYKSISFETFIKNDNIDSQESLQLRFHQDLIVDATYKFITHEDASKKRKKFIWGCVPRSGKSYMIAGMVSKCDIFLKSNNNKLIILGAKTETEGQFIEMFKMYDNFNDYGIITSKSDMKKAKENGKQKFIFILSQEKIKVNRSDEFTDKFKDDFTELLESKHIDLYFDEIHKGGSTEKSQDKLIRSILKNDIKIDLFVMVTATYARPSIAYETLVTKEPPIILNWSYIDQQNMKQITNETVLEEFKQSRNNELERKVIDELLYEYEGKYGKDYLFTLEEFYKKYPELVIIQPFIDTKQVPFDLHGNVFKLKCSAIGKTIDELSDPSKIFESNVSVVKLLDFIGKTDKDLLEPNTIYGKLKHKYNYDVINTRHSQIWFLPFSNLYTIPQDCKVSKKLTTTKTGYEKDFDEDHDKDLDDIKGLPNIEPLTRGLVLNMLNIPFYKSHFCFLVVHGQKIYDYYGKNVDDTLIYTRDNCVKYSETEKRQSVKDIITNYEEKTYRQGKSLIILTGSMLRLGVSLPCVDIGLNFDNIMSIDLNYQTMFRVLTERKNKSFGYYLDFYPNRSIQFLYQFNEIYGSGFKNTDNMDDMVIQLQSLLYLFNYNGLSISRIDEKQTLDLYNTLISKLELTKDSYSEHYIKGGIKTIKSLILSLGNKELITELSKIKFDTKGDKKKKQEKQVVKDGKKREVALLKDEKDDSDDDTHSVDDDTPEDDELSDINALSDILYTFTSIIGMFSSENDYDCVTLNECVSKILDKLDGVKDLKTFCDCNSDVIDVLGCYMKRISNYDISEYKNSLMILKGVLENKTSNYEVIKNSLFIIFDNIKTHIGMKDKLIYDMSSKDIQEKIEEYLPVRQVEKDKYGEVFTPMSLIQEMLDKLPKSVWKNPDLKWLDPANGTGNFPMIAFEKLNEGLKNVDGYKDEKKRKKHIIENMLYMVELNEKNVGISKKIFGKDANIYCGSFLEDDWHKHFGVEKFDVIMGNPPWNDVKEGKRKGTNSGSKTLWDKFILKSLEVLNTNGYLAFIHPANWRGLGSLHKIWDILSNKQILYLRIFSKKDGKTYFNVSSRFDVYVLQNKKNTKATEVIDELGVKHLLELNKMPFLPNYAYKEVNKILTTEDKGIDIIYDTIYHTQYKMNKTKTSEYKYPVIHSITKEGITYWYSNTNTKGHFGVPKVILNFNEHQYSHPEQNDYEGKYGMSQISFGIPIKSKREGDLILKAIETPEFKKIIAATKWGAFQTDYRMFNYFKPDFYKYLVKDKSPKKTRKRAKSLSEPRKFESKKTTTRRKSVGGRRRYTHLKK